MTQDLGIRGLIVRWALLIAAPAEHELFGAQRGTPASRGEPTGMSSWVIDMWDEVVFVRSPSVRPIGVVAGGSRGERKTTAAETESVGSP